MGFFKVFFYPLLNLDVFKDGEDSGLTHTYTSEHVYVGVNFYMMYVLIRSYLSIYGSSHDITRKIYIHFVHVDI